MQEAEQLDHMIAAKVHDLLGFPFRPITDVLTLPIASMGFEFPSITHINLGIAIDGVARDLNHHVPAYRTMAHITLADWTCAINGCVNPFDSQDSQREFSHYYGRIPTAWIVTQKAMTKMPSPLYLRHTDQSHVSRCEMSLTHAARICALKDGCIRLHKVDKGVLNAWNSMRDVLNDVSISWFHTGETDLLLDRGTRRSKAEDLIRLFRHISQLPASKTTLTMTLEDITYWGSDGSMIPATAGALDVKTITAAISGPTSIAVLVMGRNNSILHGELMGLIMDHLLSQSWQGAQKLFSDHLNSVRITHDSKSSGGNEARLRHIPARSYYRWIINIQKSSPHITLEYTPGHSHERTTPAVLNAEADHFALWAQKHTSQLPVAPVPTFFMDEFTFWTPDDGWIESEIKSFVNSSLVKAKVQELAIGRHH
ncbi:hypothetical protein IW262DRAFT_1462703 [Armillaria fumosa]|nr:hypothetical protein IW262DRAFT_1462703 [Armillaria fumosa]